MKKALLILMLVVAIIGCKKQQQIPIQPIPSPIYTVIIDTSDFHGFGKLNQLSYSVKGNSSLEFSISLTAWDRISSYALSGQAVASIANNTINVRNVTSDVTIRVILTDTLGQAQLSTLNGYLQIKWIDRADSSRFTGAHALSWSPLVIPACDTDSYFGVIDDKGTYQEHAGAHPCDPTVTPFSITYQGVSKLGYNGQTDSTTQVGTGKVAVVKVVTLTNEHFVYEYINPIDPTTGRPTGFDYIHYATPKVP